MILNLYRRPSNGAEWEYVAALNTLANGFDFDPLNGNRSDEVVVGLAGMIDVMTPVAGHVTSAMPRLDWIAWGEKGSRTWYKLDARRFHTMHGAGSDEGAATGATSPTAMDLGDRLEQIWMTLRADPDLAAKNEALRQQLEATPNRINHTNIDHFNWESISLLAGPDGLLYGVGGTYQSSQSFPRETAETAPPPIVQRYTVAGSGDPELPFTVYDLEQRAAVGSRHLYLGDALATAEVMNRAADGSGPIPVSPRMSDQTIAEILERARSAFDAICQVASEGDRAFRMSVPVQPGDTDMLVGRLANEDVPALVTEIRRLQANLDWATGMITGLVARGNALDAAGREKEADAGGS